MKNNRLVVFLLLFNTLFLTIQCSKTADVIGTATTLNTFNNKAVGASANEILSTGKPNLVLEINYSPGYQIQQTTLDALSAFLNSYTKKGNFQLVQKQIAATGKDSLSLSDIDKIERDNRTTFNSNTQVSIYILIPDSRYSPANTLGAAYRNTSVVLFGKTIDYFSGGTNQVARWKLETTTLEHEFGHLFGLVDVGSPMQVNHKDAANPAHCNNSNCLMYYKTETTQLLGMLMNNNIPTFDANCHNDLIANGGK